MNYDKEKMLTGITSVTFKDLMEFSELLCDELINAGESAIEPHIMAKELSNIASVIITDNERHEAEKKATQKAKNKT